MTPAELQGPLEKVLLCVKAQDTRGGGRADPAPSGRRRLCRLAAERTQRAGDHPTRRRRRGRSAPSSISAPTTWSRASCTTAAAARSWSARSTARSRRGRRQLHALLRQFDDDAKLTTNIWGYLWSKLTYGALLFATALTNDSIADCFAIAALPPIFIALAREVAAVALADGVEARAVRRLRSARLHGRRIARPGQCARSTIWSRINRRSAKTHSGIWRDLAVRKRRTEADAQLGPIIRVAAETRRRRADHDAAAGPDQGRSRTARRAQGTAPAGRARRDAADPPPLHEPPLRRQARSSSPAPPTASAAPSPQAFAARGAQVWGCDLLADELAETQPAVRRRLARRAASTSATPSRCSAVVAAAERAAGQVHVLVNNAGGVLGQVGRPLETIAPPGLARHLRRQRDRRLLLLAGRRRRP